MANRRKPKLVPQIAVRIKALLEECPASWMIFANKKREIVAAKALSIRSPLRALKGKTNCRNCQNL